MTLMASPDEWPTLVGRREPEHLSVFTGNDERGRSALTLAQRIGTPPMPWQEDNILALLRTNDAGEWIHPDACIICPRQNGKSEILLVVCLYALFVRKENIVFSTQQWKTARKLAIRFREMIKARPDLSRRLASPPTLSQGQSIFTTTDGCEMLFCTRSGDTGKGLDKIDRVIYDEAYNLTEAEMTGPTLAQMAAPNPQTIYTSSAVMNDLHPNGQVLAGLRRNGLAGVRGLYFAEYMAPEPPDGLTESQRKVIREDPETARLANPSYGVIQTDSKVAKALLGLGGTALGRRSFEVDVFGWGDWPVDSSVIVSDIPPDAWADMKNRAPKFVRSAALSLERTADRKTWILTAARPTAYGPAHIEVGYAEQVSLAQAVRAVATVVNEWNPDVLVIDPKSPAAEILPHLETVGIEPEIVTAAQKARWCGGFLTAALESQLSHGDQPILNEAIGGATKRVLPSGGFVWDDTVSTATVRYLFGATLAHGALLTFGRVSKPVAAPAFIDERSSSSSSSGEMDILSAAF